MKRFLSIVLTIAMLAAVLPSAFAEDTAKEYNYVFTKAVFGSPSGNVARTTLMEMTLQTPDSSLSDPWRVAGSCYLYNVYAQSEGILWNGYADNAKKASALLLLKFQFPPPAHISRAFAILQSNPHR